MKRRELIKREGRNDKRRKRREVKKKRRKYVF